MVRRNTWIRLICVLIPAAFALIACRAEASGTYYRPGSSANGRSPLKKGQVRVGFRADFQRFSKERLANGLTARVAEVRLRTYSLTTEYGVSGDSSFYSTLSYVDNDSNAPQSPTYAPESGLGDLKFGYNKALPLGKTWNVIGTTEFGFPLRNYKTTKLTAAGDNSADLIGHVTLRGDSIAGSPIYIALGLGRKIRVGSAPDQWLWDTEVGGRVGKYTTLSTFLDAIDSDRGVGLGGPGFNGDFSLLKQTLTRWGVRALFNVGPLDGELYYAKAIQFQNQSPSDYFGVLLSGRY